MAEQREAERKQQDMAPLFQEAGLLEQFNLPPKLIRFLRRNQRAIWGTITAAVVIALAIAAFNAYKNHRVYKAAVALDVAMQAQEGQRDLLHKVQDDFSATPSALWAGIALARLDEQEGKLDAAIQKYQGVRAQLIASSQLTPLVLGKLAGLEEQKKNWDAALAYYRELGQIDGFAAGAHLSMGSIYEAQGNKDEALAMYRKFLELTAVTIEESGVDPRRQMILSRVELLQAK